jgi:hypothetical protein
MTGASSSSESSRFPVLDFDALYRGESAAEGFPAVSEATLRDVLGGAGWDIESLEPTTWRREIDGKEVEMAFWYLRAQRR